MQTFQSESHAVNTASSEVSAFIGVPSNLIEILPADRIENWKTTEDGCSFKIKGLAEISLKLESATDEKVVYASASDKPFPFKLSVSSQGDSPCTVQAAFDADVNSFMSMMLKTPLTNFLDSLGKALTEKYG